MFRIGRLILVLLTPHEDHVLHKVGEALVIRRVVVAPDIEHYRNLSYRIPFARRRLIVVLDQQHFDLIFHLKHMIFVEIACRLLEAN